MGEGEEGDFKPGSSGGRGDIIMGERGGGGGKGGGGIMVEATGFGTNHQGGNAPQKEEGADFDDLQEFIYCTNSSD